MVGAVAMLGLLAAHCTRRPEEPPAVVVDAGPPPLARSIEAPPGFALEHMGDGADLRRLMEAFHADLAKRWTQGSLVTLRQGNTVCAFERVGAVIQPLKACPEPKPGAPSITLALSPHRFGRALQDGVMPFEGVGPKGQLRVERALLERYLAPLGVPPRATKDPVDVQVFGLPDGSGWGLSFELTEPVLAALARFDLTRRYGAYADYVRSVRAWGDGTHFQWMTQLDGGGAGLRVDGQRVRLAVQAGSDWQQRLDAMLRGLEPSWVQLPVLAVERLALEAVEGKGWRFHALDQPAPTRPVIKQLAARLARWMVQQKVKP